MFKLREKAELLSLEKPWMLAGKRIKPGSGFGRIHLLLSQQLAKEFLAGNLLGGVFFSKEHLGEGG